MPVRSALLAVLTVCSMAEAFMETIVELFDGPVALTGMTP